MPSSFELRPSSTLIRPSNFAPVSPSFSPTKPAKTHQKPSKNPHFAPARPTPIPTSTPHPINPYTHSLPQSKVHATFFPARPMHESARKCTVPTKREIPPAHLNTQPSLSICLPPTAYLFAFPGIASEHSRP